MNAGTNSKIVVVTAGGPHPWVIVNALVDHFPDLHVIVESGEPVGHFLARRARIQGWISVAAQLPTMALIKLGKVVQRRRIGLIVDHERLETTPRPGQPISRVPSVNSAAFLETIAALNPDLVLLAGCRVVSGDILARLDMPVLNYHAGITPRYRGMNGGYWALASGDPGNFGTTVHYVDAGVDTGRIVAQVRDAPQSGDNIMTYPLRMAAFSRTMCVDAVTRVLDGDPGQAAAGAESRQWFHPPVWTYLWNGLAKGVW